MRNLEHPIQQTLYEDAHALYAARHAEVQERLLDPERSFTTFVHTELGGTPYFGQLGTGGITGLNIEQKILHPALALTLDEIMDAGWETDPNRQSEVEIDPEHKELRIIRYFTEKFDDAEGREKLQTIAALAIIAGRNKPDPNLVADVLTKRPDTLAIQEQAFRRAYNAIKAQALPKGERSAIGASLPKLMARLNGNASDKTIATLNKYHRGTFATSILERLMDDRTARRDITDETEFTRAPSPIIIEPEGNVPVNVVKLPFPLLPPQRDEESRGPKTEPQAAPPSHTGQQEDGQQPRLRYTFRTDWILDLAVGWEYGGDVTPDVKLNTDDPNKYQGAILFDEWGKPFAVVSDTDLARNALYYAILRELRDPITGEPQHWKVAYKGFKRDARARGVKRMEHAGQDFYERVMKTLVDAYIEHLQAEEAGDVFIPPPDPYPPENLEPQN